MLRFQHSLFKAVAPTGGSSRDPDTMPSAALPAGTERRLVAYEPRSQSPRHWRASSFLGSSDGSLSSSRPGFFFLGRVLSPSHASRLAQIRNTHRLFLGFPQSSSPWDHVSVSLPHPQKLPRKKNNGLEQGLPMGITTAAAATRRRGSDTPSFCWGLTPLASRSRNKKLQWLTPGSDTGHGVALEGWKHLSAVVEKPKNPPPHTSPHPRARGRGDRAASAFLGIG